MMLDNEEKDPQNPPKEGGEEHVPKEGSPRWNQIYGEKKHLERLMIEKDRLIEEMRQHNQQLSSVFEQSNNHRAVAETDAYTKTAKQLRKERKEAMADGNFELVGDIDEQLSDLQDKRYEQMLQKNLKEAQEKGKAEAHQLYEKTATNDFISSTPWMNRQSPEFNHSMVATAIGLETLYTQDNPNINRRQMYAEIKRQVETQFNYKKTVDIPGVESGGNGEYRSQSKDTNIILSEEERRIARAFRPDLSAKEAEDVYTKQKGVIQQRRQR